MDITYLLWLQDWRTSIEGVLDPFMEWISLFGVRTIVIFPVFVYWCLNKKKGLFILYAWKLSQTFNALVKLTACVYRPWVRDARIIPAGDALSTATGYSFPSGHTMMATPIYGGLTTCTKNKLVRAFWIVMILILMFSRNYLGVHTPQDVLVGFVLGFAAIYAAQKVFDYLDRNPGKDVLVMILSGMAGILTLVYVTYKPYPMDYVDGKLLVDPVKMTVDSWGDAGGFTTLAVLWYIESRFIKFEPTGWNLKGVTICVIGLIPLYWLIWNVRSIIPASVGPHMNKFLKESILLFYSIIVWPLVIKLFTRKKEELS